MMSTLLSSVLSLLYISPAISANFPHCDYNVSTCCDKAGFSSFGKVIREAGSQTGYVAYTARPHAPTCHLLNLIPNASQELCNASESAAESVCSVLSTSADVRRRAESGTPLMGIFTQPGFCSDLTAGTAPSAGLRFIAWEKVGSTTCWGQKLNISSHNDTQFHSLAVRLHCTDEFHMRSVAGMDLEAAWMSNEEANEVPLCGPATPLAGRRARLYQSSWAHEEGLPKWFCMNAPWAETATPYHVMLFSVGDLPCQSGIPATTTTAQFISTTPSISSGTWMICLISYVAVALTFAGLKS